MGYKTPEKETDVSPKGAVEVDEENLDQAAGGAASSGMEINGLNFTKIEFDSTQKVDPSDPSISDRTSFEEKI